MRSRFSVQATAFAVMAFVLLAGSHASAAQMSGAQIRSEIAGQRIYLKTPFGGEFPLNYRMSGRVDGDGEKLGLGRMMAPRDSGRWWVAGDRLCQQWEKWYKGRPFCFTLEKAGRDRLRWKRDDGMSGVARIAR